jgi:hypothetical protein
LKVFFKIITELFLAAEAGDFFNFENRCTLLGTIQELGTQVGVSGRQAPFLHHTLLVGQRGSFPHSKI